MTTVCASCTIVDTTITAAGAVPACAPLPCAVFVPACLPAAVRLPACVLRALPLRGAARLLALTGLGLTARHGVGPPWGIKDHAHIRVNSDTQDQCNTNAAFNPVQLACLLAASR